jgi:hypothetical protein
MATTGRRGRQLDQMHPYGATAPTDHCASNEQVVRFGPRIFDSRIAKERGNIQERLSVLRHLSTKSDYILRGRWPWGVTWHKCHIAKRKSYSVQGESRGRLSRRNCVAASSKKVSVYLGNCWLFLHQLLEVHLITRELHSVL